MEQGWKVNKEILDLIVQQVSLRAKKSKFGVKDQAIIRCLYLRLESIVGVKLPDSVKEMSLFMNQYVTFGVIPLGSGAVFNMQGFIENKDVPSEIKDLINRIFIRLDSRDLNHRFGPCSCVSCTSPALALAKHMQFLEDHDKSKTIH